MAAVEFSFPSLDAGEAGQLAQELRAELRRDGVPEAALAIQRADASNMDLGSLLELSLHYASVAVELAAIAHTIYELCRRNHAGLTIRTSRGEFHFTSSEVDAGELQRILESASGPDPHA